MAAAAAAAAAVAAVSPAATGVEPGDGAPAAGGKGRTLRGPFHPCRVRSLKAIYDRLRFNCFDWNSGRIKRRMRMRRRRGRAEGGHFDPSFINFPFMLPPSSFLSSHHPVGVSTGVLPRSQLN